MNLKYEQKLQLIYLQTLRSEPAEAKTSPLGLNLEHSTSDA